MSCQRSFRTKYETSENQAEREKHYAQQCITAITVSQTLGKPCTNPLEIAKTCAKPKISLFSAPYLSYTNTSPNTPTPKPPSVQDH